MTKLLQFNARAQYSIKKGVDTLTNAVRVTIGPKGRNVVLDHPLNTPKVLNDGVAIARGIDLEEPFTNMVVQLLKEAAREFDIFVTIDQNLANQQNISAHRIGVVVLAVGGGGGVGQREIADQLLRHRIEPAGGHDVVRKGRAAEASVSGRLHGERIVDLILRWVRLLEQI